MAVLNVYPNDSNYSEDKWYSAKLSDGTTVTVKFKGVKVPEDLKKKTVFGITNAKGKFEEKEPYEKEDGTYIPQGVLKIRSCDFCEPEFVDNDYEPQDDDLDEIF